MDVRKRIMLHEQIADDFTLYARAWKSGAELWDAPTAARLPGILERFDAKADPKVVWNDPEDAAVAFVMAANEEAIESIEPAMIDSFLLGEGPVFVADAIFRTWRYVFQKGDEWCIRRLPEGAEGPGTLRDVAWEHLRDQKDDAMWKWIDANRSGFSALAQCTVDFLREGKVSPATARIVAERGEAVLQGMKQPLRTKDSSDLPEWLLRDLTRPTQDWGKKMLDAARAALAVDPEALAKLGAPAFGSAPTKKKKW